TPAISTTLHLLRVRENKNDKVSSLIKTMDSLYDELDKKFSNKVTSNFPMELIDHKLFDDGIVKVKLVYKVSPTIIEYIWKVASFNPESNNVAPGSVDAVLDFLLVNELAYIVDVPSKFIIEDAKNDNDIVRRIKYSNLHESFDPGLRSVVFKDNKISFLDLGEFGVSINDKRYVHNISYNGFHKLLLYYWIKRQSAPLNIAKGFIFNYDELNDSRKETYIEDIKKFLSVNSPYDIKGSSTIRMNGGARLFDSFESKYFIDIFSTLSDNRDNEIHSGQASITYKGNTYTLKGGRNLDKFGEFLKVNTIFDMSYLDLFSYHKEVSFFKKATSFLAVNRHRVINYLVDNSILTEVKNANQMSIDDIINSDTSEETTEDYAL